MLPSFDSVVPLNILYFLETEEDQEFKNIFKDGERFFLVKNGVKHSLEKIVWVGV